MNIRTKLLGCMLAAACGTASAGVIQTGGIATATNGMFSSQPGVCTIDFNTGTTANTCGATYTLAGNNIVTGNNLPIYRAPSNDTSPYLTAGPAAGTPVTVSLSAQANYFGFYAGSLDSFNLVEFFLNGVLVDSFTGTDINAVAFPGTSPNGTLSQYVNYYATSFFDQIVYSSTGNSFETDNHAIGVASPVPEPGSVALFGLGLVALFAGRRKFGRK